jgi:hypothetical protein
MRTHIAAYPGVPCLHVSLLHSRDSLLYIYIERESGGEGGGGRERERERENERERERERKRERVSERRGRERDRAREGEEGVRERERKRERERARERERGEDMRSIVGLPVWHCTCRGVRAAGACCAELCLRRYDGASCVRDGNIRMPRRTPNAIEQCVRNDNIRMQGECD